MTKMAQKVLEPLAGLSLITTLSMAIPISREYHKLHGLDRDSLYI